MLNHPVIINPLRTYLHGQTSFLNEGNLFTTPFNWISRKIKSHTCEEDGAHLKSFFLAFIDQLEKQIIIKRVVEMGQ